MSIQVNEFHYVKGQNDEEYIRLLEEELKIQEKLTAKAIARLKEQSVERKRGEWIDKGWKGDWQFETDGRGNCWYEYECSECGFHNKGSKSNFCPNCGADMRGDINDTE